MLRQQIDVDLRCIVATTTTRHCSRGVVRALRVRSCCIFGNRWAAGALAVAWQRGCAVFLPCRAQWLRDATYCRGACRLPPALLCGSRHRKWGRRESRRGGYRRSSSIYCYRRIGVV